MHALPPAYSRALPTPAPGEIVGFVAMPWAGSVVVDLDSAGQRVRVEDSAQFHFAHVAVGSHVLLTNALGFEPQADTITVPAQGLAVRITPRRPAVCRL
jgi:hypothetical protein